MDLYDCVQPCNPAVGGPAKSQLVHEVDAMGGEMGKMADKCYLQKRILNRSKVCAASTRAFDVALSNVNCMLCHIVSAKCTLTIAPLTSQDCVA